MSKIEAIYGDCWKTLARDEGHMKRLPPGVRSTVVVKTEEVEERRDRIVSFISRNPGLCGAEVRRSLRIKVDTFSNDIARLGTEGRVVWTKGLNNRRLYYVDG